MPKRNKKPVKEEEEDKKKITLESSSSDDDDGERDKLLSALDPTLFGTSTSRRKGSTHNDGSDDQVKTKNEVPKKESSEVHGVILKNGDLIRSSSNSTRKSNRPKDSEMEEEYAKPYSLDVTPECQKFIAKKLTKVLERNIEDILATATQDSNPTERQNKSDRRGIYLMKSSKQKISDKDVINMFKPQTKKQKKPKLRVVRHIDGSESEDEDLKLQHVAVTADWVLNKNSV